MTTRRGFIAVLVAAIAGKRLLETFVDTPPKRRLVISGNRLGGPTWAEIDELNKLIRANAATEGYCVVDLSPNERV